MLAWFKKAVAWLCIAALPVQGWAAAAMLNCGPSHHRIASAAASGVHAFHRHGDELAGSLSHTHDGGGERHEEARKASTAEPVLSRADLESLSKFKCSACAACCSPAAMPTTALILDVSAPVSFIAPMRAHSDVMFLTCGTERPPRSLLA